MAERTRRGPGRPPSSTGPRPTVHAKIDPEDYDALCRHVLRRGTTINAVVRELIRQARARNFGCIQNSGDQETC